MNPLEKATALLEAATDADLARLCGAERLVLFYQLQRWDRALARSAPRRADDPKPGVLGKLEDGERSA